MVAEEQASMNRANKLIESAKRLREDVEMFIADATEQRVAEEQRTRDAAQTKAMPVHQVMLAGRQHAKLKEQENERLRVQIEQSRVEVVAHQLMARLRNNKQIGKLMKVTGLVVAMAFIGLSLPIFYVQEMIPVEPAVVSQSIHAATNQADKNEVAATQTGLIVKQVRPTTYLALGELKLS